MLWVHCKFYRIAAFLEDEESAYKLICNLVKWGEGGLQYDSLMKLHFDEVLALNEQARRINKESQDEANKQAKR